MNLKVKMQYSVEVEDVPEETSRLVDHVSSDFSDISRKFANLAADLSEITITDEDREKQAETIQLTINELTKQLKKSVKILNKVEDSIGILSGLKELVLNPERFNQLPNKVEHTNVNKKEEDE